MIINNLVESSDSPCLHEIREVDDDTLRQSYLCLRVVSRKMSKAIDQRGSENVGQFVSVDRSHSLKILQQNNCIGLHIIFFFIINKTKEKYIFHVDQVEHFIRYADIRLGYSERSW